VFAARRETSTRPQTSSDPPARDELGTLRRLRGLLEVSRLSRGDADLDELLATTAATIGESLGFGTVAINLYRPAWDDFHVAAVHGNSAAREALLGTSRGAGTWEPLFAARFLRRGAYHIRNGEYDWSADPSATFVPDLEAVDDPDVWHPEDALFVPLTHSDGHLLGIVSVDEPRSRRRPSDEEIDVLVAVAAHAARAVEDAQSAAAEAQNRAALEHLHQISAHLNETLSVDAVLQSVADGISAALGFRNVCVALRDGDSFRPKAVTGWRASDPVASMLVSLDELRRLTEPRFEVEGCYLLPLADALQRVPSGGAVYQSQRNGHGPRAWARHWLLVPLEDPAGEVVGFVWADEPDDRLLPSREKLKVLRMFGNQAATALALAGQFEAIREGNDKRRALIASSPLAIFELDLDLVVRSWNPAAERMYGWAEREIVGQRYPLVEQHEIASVEALLQRVMAGERHHDEQFTRRRRDGSTIEVSASAAPLRNQKDEIVGVTIVHADITDRVQAQRELAARHRELEALHDTTIALLERFDLESVLRTIVGRASELLGASCAALYLTDGDDLVRRVGDHPFAERIRKGQGLAGRVWESGESGTIEDYRTWPGRLSTEVELETYAAAGAPLRSAEEVVGVLAVIHDTPERRIEPAELELLERLGRLASLAVENARLYDDAQRELQERRLAETALRKSEELYRRVVDSSHDVITLLAPDGTVRFASASAEGVLGYASAELEGKALGTLVHPDDLGFAQAAVGAALTGSSESTVARVRHRDGHWVEMEGIAGPVLDESGQPEMILTISRDVTERRRAEERRAELEEQLRQSQKMEAVGRLAGGIAHDFNNLLTAIGGYGELALAALDEEHERPRHDVEQILKSAARARDLTRQLLAFSRKQVLQPRVVSLNEIVDGLVPMLARLIGADIELVTRADEGLGVTKADPSQLEQVLLNLALNARDAMPGGGRLTIETANAELDDEYASRHLGAAPGSYVVLAVSDTGHGMTEDVRAQVFEPFFTTKGPTEGTGLGLATVYGIVKQSAGYVWVYSEPGHGSTFKVYLPRAADPAESTGPKREAPAPARGSETVLLVEDEDVVRALVREILESFGYDVLEAPDGAAALETSSAHDGPIDLVLTDVVMPGMGGPELISRLRGKRPDAKVVFTSGYSEDAIANDGVLHPGARFLEKPFTAATLAETVRGALDAA
jgi:two-component system cell cycle sensor histidine kinase/response regulator CckA